MDGKKSTTTQPGDFSNDRIERILAEGREALRRSKEARDDSRVISARIETEATEAHSVPVVSRAPPPPSPIRRPSSGIPPRPKPTQMPMGWPPYYPNDLIPLTTVIIGETLKKFPVQTQTLPLCRYVISKLTPHLCAAVQRKTLRADLALSVMGDLLHYLRVANCDDDNQRFRLHRETIKSDEWLKLAGEIARVHSAAEKDGGRTDRRGVSQRRRGKADPDVMKRNTAIANLKKSHASLNGINLSRTIAQKLTEMDIPPLPRWNVSSFKAAYRDPQLRPRLHTMFSKVKVD